MGHAEFKFENPAFVSAALLTVSVPLLAIAVMHSFDPAFFASKARWSRAVGFVGWFTFYFGVMAFVGVINMKLCFAFFVASLVGLSTFPDKPTDEGEK